MTMGESGEMYLETLLMLSKKQEYVISNDLAVNMGFSRPSVSRAVKLLKQDKYIDVDADGHLTLTHSGLEIAEKIYERHLVISKFFESIGVSADTAAEDACRIEHVISDESFAKLKAHIKKTR
ncbi:MAG: metal-dependent transcriptional regulator [Clostridiales bacterium]|nr:metal-dependent transcriptional regulator [Clostridiales bacterium]